MRAVCYARVSSASQRERDTIASQIRVLPEFIERQGWTLVKPVETYIDDGRTAKAGHLEAREGLNRLLGDAVLGIFDVVVILDIDRLTRAEDLTERGAILGAFQRARVKLASAMSGQVLDLSTSTGDLFTSLHAFFAAEWTRKHRERVTQGKITAIKRNRKPAGRPPYGYAYDKATGTWGHDPLTAPIVRELFERCAGGESVRAICADFLARGVPGALGTIHGAWNAVRLIRRRAVRGEWTADKTRKLVVTLPPLVDEDLWQRAQQALDRHRFRGLRKTRHEYLCEGLGICAGCGALMGIRTASFDRRRRGTWAATRYCCITRRYHGHGGRSCSAPTLRVDEVDRRVWDALRIELEDPGLAVAIGGEMAGAADEAAAWRDDAAGYREHLARLERVEANVLERYRRDMISDAVLDQELARLRQERDAVRAQLETAERAQLAAGDARTRLDEAMSVLDELRAALDDASFEVRRRLVELLIPKGGIVFDGTQLKLTLLVPKGGRRALAGDSAFIMRHETCLRIRVVA